MSIMTHVFLRWLLKAGSIEMLVSSFLYCHFQPFFILPVTIDPNTYLIAFSSRTSHFSSYSNAGAQSIKKFSIIGLLFS